MVVERSEEVGGLRRFGTFDARLAGVVGDRGREHPGAVVGARVGIRFADRLKLEKRVPLAELVAIKTRQQDVGVGVAEGQAQTEELPPVPGG